MPLLGKLFNNIIIREPTERIMGVLDEAEAVNIIPP